MRARLGLGLAALLILGSAAAGRAQDDVPYYEDDQDAGQPVEQEAAPEDYNQALSPYGSWMYDPSYGQVWRPAVPYGWRPYTDGSWAWGSWGWTWVSAGPWAWTFHYGRWVLTPAGWVWVPGDVWGPAWVSWFWGDGFVGWAPLNPFGTTVFINNFVFVNERSFCHPHVNRVIVDSGHVPPRVFHDWGGRHFRAPDFGQVERVASHPPRRLDRRPAETLAPWQRRAALRMQGPGAVPRLGRGRMQQQASADTPRDASPPPARVARLGRPAYPPPLRLGRAPQGFAQQAGPPPQIRRPELRRPELRRNAPPPAQSIQARVPAGARMGQGFGFAPPRLGQGSRAVPRAGLSPGVGSVGGFVGNR